MMRSIWLSACAVILMPFQLAHTVFADDSRDELVFLQQGMASRHAKLHSCEVNVNHAVTNVTIANAGEMQRTIVFASEDDGNWRSISVQDFRRVDESGKKTQVTFNWRICDGVVNSSNSIHPWQIQVLNLADCRPSTFRIFNLSSAGLWLVPSLESGDSLNDLIESMNAKYKIQKITKHGGIHEVAFVIDGEVQIGWTIWIDEARGFVPTRFTATLNGHLHQQASTRWIEIGGVMLPEESTIEWFQGKELAETHRLSFDWVSVNEPLERKLFSRESLKGDDGLIVDARLGRPVVSLARTGKEILPQPPLAARTGGRSRTFWFLAIGNAVVLALVGFGFWKRRRRIALGSSTQRDTDTTGS